MNKKLLKKKKKRREKEWEEIEEEEEKNENNNTHWLNGQWDIFNVNFCGHMHLTAPCTHISFADIVAAGNRFLLLEMIAFSFLLL